MEKRLIGTAPQLPEGMSALQSVGRERSLRPKDIEA